MKFKEYLKSLFCCMFPRYRRPEMLTADTSCVPDSPPPTPVKTVVQRPREKVKRMLSLTSCFIYKRKDMILDKIAFKYETIVIISCHKYHNPARAKIFSLLHSLGDVRGIRDRWHESGRYLERLWRGAIVEYDSKEQAMHASFVIPLQVKYLQTTMLKTIIIQVAACEKLHPLCHKIPSKLVISRRTPLREAEVSDLHDYLNTYGTIQNFIVNNGIVGLGMMCEVTYSYLTQAYLAIIMIDGQCYNGDILKATFEKTDKDREILRNAKKCMFLVSHYYFPFLDEPDS